jgi:oligosaccharide repeat unit polymerase
MNATNPSRPALAVPSAAFEIPALFALVGAGALAFLLGWLTPEQAGVLTLCLLLGLDILAWNRFGHGRHPCFLFLCILTVLQGGRLIAYCAGVEPRPMRIGSFTTFPFDISRSQAGLVLVSLALSAVCVYAPCRWKYRWVAPPSDQTVRRYLPYLYLLFYATLPIQLFKNYRYYQYIQEHGGYLQFWISHGDVASSVPLLVRAIVLVNFPVFVAIFAFERKKKWLYVTTTLYFVSTIFTLLLGLRGGIFAMVLVLWYVAAMKSTKKSRLMAIAALAFVLVIVGDVVQALREDTDATLSDYTFAPVEFLKLQGNSLDVTAVAITYKPVFERYSYSYLWHEMQNAFVSSDVGNYFRGKSLAFDVPVFLSPTAFVRGRGTGGSYIGEAYVIGGLGGVIVISLLIGLGLHSLYRLSGNAVCLFFVAMILPDVIGMPRGELLDWFSVLLRTFLSVAVLACGWMVYSAVTWLMRAPGRVHRWEAA